MKDREESSSSSSSMTTKKTNGIINNGEHEPRDINIRSFSSVPSSPRNASSKYDFVKVRFFFRFGWFLILLLFQISDFFFFFVDGNFFKVKVWLGDNADHYYVLSRFLVCRMLTVTKVCSISTSKSSSDSRI